MVAAERRARAPCSALTHARPWQPWQACAASAGFEAKAESGERSSARCSLSALFAPQELEAWEACVRGGVGEELLRATRLPWLHGGCTLHGLGLGSEPRSALWRGLSRARPCSFHLDFLHGSRRKPGLAAWQPHLGPLVRGKTREVRRSACMMDIGKTVPR